MPPVLELPPAESLMLGPAGTGGLVVGGSGLLRGWALEETSAVNPARVALLDGAAASGQLLVPVRLAPNESTRELLPGRGLLFQGGVFGNVTAGAVLGSVFVTLEAALPPESWRALLEDVAYAGEWS